MPSIIEDIPDVIAYRNPGEVRQFIAAYGLEITGVFENIRPFFSKFQVTRDGLHGAILTAPIASLTVNDVRSKFVCGEIPYWMAMHAKWVIVFEPDIPKMSEGAFSLACELRPPVNLRLAAYDVFRKVVTHLPIQPEPLTDLETEAVETMTL